ncbi:MAG: SbcC/MukB-like Walker B domain-containing protein, partial [Candidatus Thermoplasmatota archaeon]|nr:SbcC/MukB-like Walker B domain-containing protein [Candidatus Thermoplasmatota archaeon]
MGDHHEKLLEKYGKKKKLASKEMEVLANHLAELDSQDEMKEKLMAALRKKRARLEETVKEALDAEKDKALLVQNLNMIKDGREKLLAEVVKMKDFEYEPQVHMALREDVKALEKKVSEFMRLSERLKALPELAEEKEEHLRAMESAMKRKKEAEEKLVRVDFDNAKYAGKKIDVAAVDVKKKKMMETISSIRVEKAGLESSLKSMENQISEMKKAEEKIKKWAEEISYLQALAGSRSSDPAAFNSFLSYLTDRVRPVLRTHASELFNLITENRYGGMEIDDNYAIGIYDMSSEPLPVSRFSGGEEDVANLCLRIAVSKAIWERSDALLEFIILDEIFGSQDARRRENILMALDRLSGEFRQVFVITQIDDIKDHVGCI